MINNFRLTNNDLIIYLFLILTFYLIFYLLLRIEKKILNLLRIFYQFLNKKNFVKLILFFYLTFQLNIVFQYVKNKSIELNPFIDEYVSLSSTFHLLNDLDFNAGGFLAGTFSVYITSGPLSSIGSVIGWSLLNNIFYARIFNYFWAVFLFFITSEIIIRKFDLSRKYFLIFLSPFLLIIPWWQGTLYAIGEIPSLILLTTAILTFQKSRKLSLFLFAISIFLGKFLNILIFVIFYLTSFIQNRSTKKLFSDIIFFIIPIIPWFLLINFTYNNGNIYDYFTDLYRFVTDSSASGVGLNNVFDMNKLRESIQGSEFNSWNIYEKIRIGFLPIIGLILFIKNRNRINTKFGNITYPLSFSLSGIYIWFWILNPLKWIRYSQHITVLVLILTLYFIIHEVYEKENDILIGSLLIVFFLDNTKNYFIYFLVFILLIFIITNKNYKKTSLILTVSILISFDIAYSVFSKDGKSIPNHETGECNLVLNSDECRESYFSLFYE